MTHQDWLKALGTRCRTARQTAGLHQWQLAEMARVSEGTIFLLEKGRRDSGISTIAAIAVVLDVTVDWLCWGDDGQDKA